MCHIVCTCCSVTLGGKYLVIAHKNNVFTISSSIYYTCVLGENTQQLMAMALFSWIASDW